MLKQYPTLRFILMRAGWYLVTFLVAVTINFLLPRLGRNDPVDIIMGRAGTGLSPENARLMEEKLLKDFGLAKVQDGQVVRDSIWGSVIDTVVSPVVDSVWTPVVDARGLAVLDTAGMPLRELTLNPVLDSAGRPVVDVAITARFDENGDTLTRLLTTRPVRASLIEQFAAYVGMCFRGDLGTSLDNKKVSSIIKEAVPWTLALQLPTILFGWIVGNLLGALAAYKRGIFDKVFFPVAIMLSSFPFFVFGMLLVYVFGIHLQWFPSMGGYYLGAEIGFTWAFFSSVAYHYVLPFFSIFLILAGGQAIGMRSMGIYELGTDYIKYAKWLGLKEGKVLMYLFRNAMLPQITGLALSLGTMVGGALITEMIFSYPGLGMAMLDAIGKNDFFVIQGVTLIITTSVLIANFSVDILIAFLDPRVKAGLKMGGGK